MRGIPVFMAGLFLVLTPARAQVITNDGALDQLAPQRAPATRPKPPHRTTTRSAPANPATPRTAPQTATPASPKTAKPAIPVSPPAIPVSPPVIPVSPPAILALPPAVVVPLAHPPPPPVVPLADDAPGTVTPIQNGIRITFGADRSDLSPATAAAVTQFASGLAAQPTVSINLFAFAAGTPDDPSTPRRLSLQRALAARAVLLKAGIPSPRIYPRALGPAGGDAPDRVDVVTGSPTPPPAASHASGSGG